jgi:2-polyprenyl-6-methoxyphenol hydroxylase-like FAD-dependent oxidoreductase
VTASAVNLDAGTRSTIECDYLVGCDGQLVCAQVDRLRVRRHSGAPIRAIFLCAGAAAQEPAARQAGLGLFLAQCAPLRHDMAVDGRETWNIQNYSYPGETGLAHLDHDCVIRSILGVGPDFEYELLSCENWIARRLVASKFRDQRGFICGDAAHL